MSWTARKAGDEIPDGDSLPPEPIVKVAGTRALVPRPEFVPRGKPAPPVGRDGRDPAVPGELVVVLEPPVEVAVAVAVVLGVLGAPLAVL